MSALLSLASALLAFMPCSDDEAPPPRQPSSFHVGTFLSDLATRVDESGAIDSGDGVLTLFDAETGEDLVPRNMRYDRGPKLNLLWDSDCSGVQLDTRFVSIPLTAGGDTRLTTAILLTVQNPSEEAVTLSPGVRLRAGGVATAEQIRPREHLPFDAASRYTRDDNALLRDERIVMRWTGTKPEVSVTEAASGPDDVVCELTWPELEIAPRTLYSITLFLAGPPTTERLSEKRWRRLLESLTYVTAEERSLWQSKTYATVRIMRLGDKPTFRGLRSAIFMTRLLGRADDTMYEARARPYGLGGTTLAEQAEVLVPYFHWSMAGAVLKHLETTLAEATEQAGELPPKERLALAAALAQCVRLGGSRQLVEALGVLLRDHICVSEMEGVEVRSWQDPARVAGMIKQVLADASIEAEVPTFAWATVEEGTPPAAFQALCRATSDRDRDGIMSALTAVQSYYDVNETGNMDPDGEPDVAFGLAYLESIRNLIIDDYGDDLVLMPGITNELLNPTLEMPLMATRFGLTRFKAWWTTMKRNRRFNIDLTITGGRTVGAVLWGLPDDREVERVRVVEDKGALVVREPGLVEIQTNETQLQGEVMFVK